MSNKKKSERAGGQGALGEAYENRGQKGLLDQGIKRATEEGDQEIFFGGGTRGLREQRMPKQRWISKKATPSAQIGNAAHKEAKRLEKIEEKSSCPHKKPGETL